MTPDPRHEPPPDAVILPDGVPDDLGELAAKLGIRLTELTTERAQAQMPVKGNRQPVGLLHGGASAALAETLGSVHSLHCAPPDRVAVGVELNCTHHRSARNGSVTAISRPLHIGSSLATFDIAVTDGSGRRICSARLTVAFIPARPAQ